MSSVPQVPAISASALNVCRCRAIAAHDPREDIRGADHLAEVFLDEAARKSLTDPATHTLILKKLEAFSPGSYEYFIARTAYLDEVVEQALRDETPQLVFLGAGFDTRAYRFQHLLHKTRVFELDSVVTQQFKRLMFTQAGFTVPDQVTFIPIDFTTENLAARLSQAGYANDQKTCFIWEGVTYYLPLSAVNEILDFIRCNSLPGSQVCFDYMLPIADLEGKFGAQQARTAMQSLYTAEPLQFDLAEAEVNVFLEQRGFELVEHLTAAQLQARYLTLANGTPAGSMLDLFRLVRAQHR